MWLNILYAVGHFTTNFLIYVYSRQNEIVWNLDGVMRSP